MKRIRSLHVIYRLTARENSKGRPHWYSKTNALASVLHSLHDVRTAPTSIHFFIDGQVSRAAALALAHFGEVMELPAVGKRASYWRAVQIALRQGWPDEDLVYFCEDDYLHQPHAFSQLLAAASQLDGAAEFFSLYEHPNAYPRSNGHKRGYDALEKVFFAGGQHWRTMRSTCMTYGVGLPTLRRMAWMHHQVALPSLPGFHRTRDYALWRSHQNRIARTTSDVSSVQQSWGPRLASYWFAALAVSRPVHSLTRIRTLIAPMPSLATHIESDYLALGVDWAPIAEDAARWARGRGLPDSFGAKPLTVYSRDEREPVPARHLQADGARE